MLGYALFNSRVIHTRITAPTKATMIEPIMPPPGQIPSIPNNQPPTMPPRMPRMMSTSTPYPPPFITFPASHPEKRSEEHTSELQSQSNLVCRLLLENKKR